MSTLLRPGDFVILAAGIGLVGALAANAFQTGAGETAVVRVGGQIVQTLPLARNQMLVVAGPLGQTQIEVRDGRARVASDPSPRQHCVRQGWLARAGEVALCLPNQVSVEIPARPGAYDTRVY